jgi:membrane protease YdiL (CAAX protease family)
VFFISWGSGLALHVHALALFPVLILSVAGAALILTRIVDGTEGLRRLWNEAKTWRIGWWYTLALVPPALILIALFTLRAFAGPPFSPNFFPVGFLFGIPAGLFEEIGWTGYALPKLIARMSWQRTSVVLGVLWGLWHLPVVDGLGAAVPHGEWLPAFTIAFIAAVSALRVLITWAALRTRSLLIAQLIHISSTGSLVMFGPPRVSPPQEALWYGAYAAALWIVAAVLLFRHDDPRR